MPSLTEFPWNHVSPEIRQRIGERFRIIAPLLHTRLSLLHALGIGIGFFLLPYVLWWLTSISSTPVPPRAPQGLELHQLVQGLHTALADPALGQPNARASSALAAKDAEVAVRFVIQPTIIPGGDTTYRLVPVDTALQPRPEHVQTLTIRLTSTPPLPHKSGASMDTAPEVWPPKDGDLPPPARLKKRTRS